MNINMNEANEIYYGEYVSDFKSFIKYVKNTRDFSHERFNSVPCVEEN